jgi:hypothetical protein
MLRVRATRNREGDVMVAVTEQQQETPEESQKVNSGATAMTPNGGAKQASADHGPDLLPDMVSSQLPLARRIAAVRRDICLAS